MMKKSIIPINENDHVKGDLSAAIKIVEYGDFECSSCGLAYPIFKQIERTFGTQICIAYRHFPLEDLHPFAMNAAVAAEAAGLQGKFWEMYHAIYREQEKLSEASLYRLAERICLNRAKFETDMLSKSIAEKIRNDVESGIASGVQGIPTFFVNGQLFDGGASELYNLLYRSAGRDSRLMTLFPSSDKLQSYLY